jgi:tight adherence protein B
LAKRLGTLADPSATPDIFPSRPEAPLIDALGFVGRHFEDVVLSAGRPYPPSGLAIRIGLASVTGAVVLGSAFSFRAGILGLFIGVIPWIHMRRLATQRTLLLSEQLPDSLDLLGRSLQAGHGIADAMRLCAEEMPQPIAREFGQVYEQHNLGREFRECLVDLADRNPHNFDMRIFVSSVQLQRETGGNLVEILDNIASTIRARFIFKAKSRSLTAEVRMSEVILGTLPFVVSGAILWLRPDYLVPLVTDPMGRSMMLVCGILFGAGVLLMRSLAQVEV